MPRLNSYPLRVNQETIWFCHISKNEIDIIVSEILEEKMLLSVKPLHEPPQFFLNFYALHGFNPVRKALSLRSANPAGHF